MDGIDASGNSGGQYRRFHFSALCAVCFPDSGCAIRKLVAAPYNYSDCSDVSVQRNFRSLAARNGQQHLHADRIRGVGRVGVQECDPDCAICQATAGRRPFALRCRRRSQPLAFAPDFNDLLRLHLRSYSTGAGFRGRR